MRAENGKRNRVNARVTKSSAKKATARKGLGARKPAAKKAAAKKPATKKPVAKKVFTVDRTVPPPTPRKTKARV